MGLRRRTNANRRGSFGARAFTPASLAGLVGWWDFSDAGTLTTSGSEITGITNKGSGGADLTAPGTGPTLTSGYASFDGSSGGQRLTGTWSGSPFSGATAVTALWLGRYTGSGGASAFWEAHTGGLNTAFNGYVNSGNRFASNFKATSSALRTPNGGTSDGDWHVFAAQGLPAATTLSVDGVAGSSGGTLSGDIVEPTSMMLGGLVGVFDGDVDIMHLVIYPRELTADELASLSAYLEALKP